MNAEQYLAWERTQPERHEFFRGEVFEMAGGRPRHAALAAGRESYRAMPSVTDYLLVSPSSARIEHYRREAGADWHYHVAEDGDRVMLSSGAAIEVAAVYAGVFEVDPD